MQKIMDGPGTTKNLVNRDHDTIRRAKKAAQKRGPKTSKVTTVIDRYRMGLLADRRKAGTNTLVALTDKLKKHPEVLTVVEDILDTYASDKQHKVNGSNMSPLNASIHFAEVKFAKNRSVVKAATRAVREELAYQLGKL